MSFEADFVSLQIWQDMNTTVAWTWDNFGSDRFYSFNVAPYQANDPKCQIVDFFWTSKNVEPPSNLFANLVVSNGATNYVQFQVIGIPKTALSIDPHKPTDRQSLIKGSLRPVPKAGQFAADLDVPKEHSHLPLAELCQTFEVEHGRAANAAKLRPKSKRN